MCKFSVIIIIIIIFDYCIKPNKGIVADTAYVGMTDTMAQGNDRKRSCEDVRSWSVCVRVCVYI